MMGRTFSVVQSLTVPLEARALRKLIATYEETFPAPLLPTWVFSNHDRVRRIERLGGDLERAKANAALQLTARGVPFIYYGEEIGMRQHRMPVRTSRDALAQRLGRVPQVVHELVRFCTHETINRSTAFSQMRIVDLAACVAAHEWPGPEVRFNLTITDPLDELKPGAGLSGDYTVVVGEPSSIEDGHTDGLPVMEATINAFTR